MLYSQQFACGIQFVTDYLQIMVKKTPFYPRLSALNETMLWEHWAGYITPVQYQFSEKFEYYGIRNSAGIFDTSPLFKYRIFGDDATRFLAGVLARDIRNCKPNQAQYTIWCDENGWLIEDGVILRVAKNEYWLTSARPNLRYFHNLIGRANVQIEDISDQYGIVALQGPRSLDILQKLSKAVAKLPYFGITQTKIAKKPVTISRTGYTGDLGYELWIEQGDALLVWDALMDAGNDYNLIPFGVKALSMTRIEAGLILIDVDFQSARHAWVDEQRSTPLEVGLGWMFRNLAKSNRPFIGRKAIEQEIAGKTSRWKFVGLEVDWQTYEQTYNQLGLVAPKDHTPIEHSISLYNAETQWMGYATSFVYSSLLKKHIGLGKLPPEITDIGSEIYLEITINKLPHYVLTKVVPLPFYNPARKTA